MKSRQRISQLPRPTWSWLHINSVEAEVEDTPVPFTASVTEQIPDGFLAEQNAENTALHIVVPQNTMPADVLRLEYRLDEESRSSVSRVKIVAEPGSKSVVVLRYSGQGAQQGNVTLHVGEQAELTFMQLQGLGDTATHIGTVDAVIEKGGKAVLLLAELGSAKAVSGCDVRLAGQGARADLNALYLGSRQQHKDMNYRIRYEEEATEGHIAVHGALTGNAYKVLKSTIDFARGASGSIGREEENVLVLNDAVRNISAPLLLCREDNVQGEHATNIGRPAREKLYYLMSRGFTRREAQKLLVEGGFAPFLRALPQPEREAVQAYIREVLDNAG